MPNKFSKANLAMKGCNSLVILFDDCAGPKGP